MYQVDYRDTGLPLETIRSVSKVSDGIEVTVSVSAPQTMRYDGLNLADIKDPANNKSVFQARYQVWWKEPTKGFESLGGVLCPRVLLLVFGALVVWMFLLRL